MTGRCGPVWPNRIVIFSIITSSWYLCFKEAMSRQTTELAVRMFTYPSRCRYSGNRFSCTSRRIHRLLQADREANRDQQDRSLFYHQDCLSDFSVRRCPKHFASINYGPDVRWSIHHSESWNWTSSDVCAFYTSCACTKVFSIDHGLP